VLALLAENQELKVRLSLIEEQIKQNSQNSSKPPSKDGFGAKLKGKKAKIVKCFDVQNIITIPHAKLIRKLGSLTPEQLVEITTHNG
jgi:Family of unknown function (DUF6444)